MGVNPTTGKGVFEGPGFTTELSEQEVIDNLRLGIFNPQTKTYDARDISSTDSLSPDNVLTYQYKDNTIPSSKALLGLVQAKIPSGKEDVQKVLDSINPPPPATERVNQILMPGGNPNFVYAKTDSGDIKSFDKNTWNAQPTIGGMDNIRKTLPSIGTPVAGKDYTSKVQIMERVSQGNNGWEYYSDGDKVYRTQGTPQKDSSGKGYLVNKDMAEQVPGKKEDYLPWYKKEYGKDKKDFLNYGIDKTVENATDFANAITPILKNLNEIPTKALQNIYGEGNLIHPTQELFSKPLKKTRDILGDMLIGDDEVVMAEKKTKEMLDLIEYKTTFEGLIQEDAVLKNLPTSEKLTLLKLYKQLVDMTPTVAKQDEVVRNIFRTSASIGSTSIDPQTAQALLKMEDYFGRIINNAKGIMRRDDSD